MSEPRDTSALLSLGLGTDQQGALLSEGGRPPLVGTLDHRILEVLDLRLQRLFLPGTGLLVPGDDGEAVRVERQVGAELSSLLRGDQMQEIYSRLIHLAGMAEGSGGRLCLLIDARSPALRRLPWELLEAVPQGAMGRVPCRVLRVSQAPPARLPARATHLEVLLYLVDPDDRVCQREVEAVRALLSKLPRTRVLDASLEALTPVDPHELRIVHLISHGLLQEGQVLLQRAAARTLAPDSTQRWLSALLEGVGVVLMDVCGGGSGTPHPLDVPAGRLLAGGIPAVIAPQQALGVDASQAFAGGFYRSLSAGLSLAESVSRGRQAIAGLGLHHPACRWWNPLLMVADGVVAHWHLPVFSSETLAGWPMGDPEAEAVLKRALELARAQGFLGVEHLALALARQTPPGPLVTLFQNQLEALGQRLPAFGLSHPSRAHLTPRLQALAEDLPEGFSVLMLLRALARIPWVERSLGPVLLQQLITGSSETQAPERATVPLELDRSLFRNFGLEPSRLRLEVTGGPEDGRVIELLTPGQQIGRWDPARPGQESTQLYCGDGPSDRGLSRAHLSYLGGHSLGVLVPTRLIRHDEQFVFRAGTIQVAPGDVLLVGAATQLTVLGDSGLPGASPGVSSGDLPV